MTSKVSPVLRLQWHPNKYRRSWFPAIADRFDSDCSDNPVAPRLLPTPPKLRSFPVAFLLPLWSQGTLHSFVASLHRQLCEVQERLRTRYIARGRALAHFGAIGKCRRSQT